MDTIKSFHKPKPGLTSTGIFAVLAALALTASAVIGPGMTEPTLALIIILPYQAALQNALMVDTLRRRKYSPLAIAAAFIGLGAGWAICFLFVAGGILHILYAIDVNGAWLFWLTAILLVTTTLYYIKKQHSAQPAQTVFLHSVVGFLSMLLIGLAMFSVVTHGVVDSAQLETGLMRLVQVQVIIHFVMTETNILPWAARLIDRLEGDEHHQST